MQYSFAVRTAAAAAVRSFVPSFRLRLRALRAPAAPALWLAVSVLSGCGSGPGASDIREGAKTAFANKIEVGFAFAQFFSGTDVPEIEIVLDRVEVLSKREDPAFENRWNVIAHAEGRLLASDAEEDSPLAGRVTLEFLPKPRGRGWELIASEAEFDEAEE